MTIEAKKQEPAHPRIRFGMVGGGSGALIGGVHRMAARLDNRFELVAGALSSTPETALESGRSLGLAEDRIYSDYKAMAIREARLKGGIEAVSIVTPNHLHYDVAKEFLKRGIHVICDKPLTATLSDARKLKKLADESGALFVLTHNYTGYPLVRQARAMIANGELGDIRVVQVEYAQLQFDRASDLTDKGINTKSTLDQARTDLDKAKQEQAVAEQGIVSAKAALGGNPDIQTDQHPTVLAALAARDKAAYDLAQTTVRAPGDGIIYQASSFKVGQYVNSGTALFTLVETGDTWISANFKETQLTHMKPGQKADVELDTYPGKVFKATVEAIGAGTGAEFSLLPAQNATGNWVKVTQRIPVRLKLDDPDIKVALRTGMSADVTVDTGVARGFGALFGNAFAGEANHDATPAKTD